MKLKRIAACLMCLVLTALLSTAVYAEQATSMDTLSKQYVLRMSETHGTIEAKPETPAFWEYPILHAGEEYTEGTFVIRNESNRNASMELNEVTLPYGDTAKLNYLNHLELTVKEGDDVLFDDLYVHVNDPEGGLKIVLEDMAPGEEHTYTVKLRCHFDYKGNASEDASQLTWLFSASSQAVTYEGQEGLPDWAMNTLIIFAVMIVLLIIIMIVRAIIVASKKRKAKKD